MDIGQTEAQRLIERGPSVSDNFCGIYRRRLGWKATIFMVVSILALILAIVFTVLRMVELNSNDAKFTFAILILLNAVFCIIFVFLGVIYERVPELVVIIVAFLATLVILTIDFVQTTHKTNDYVLARFICFCVCFVIVVPPACILACCNINNYNELPFRTGITDAELQKSRYIESLFRSVLLLDMQVSLTLVPILWPEGIHFDTYDRYFIIPTATASIVTFIAGHIFVWKRNMRNRYVKIALCVVYFVGWLIILFYAIYLIYKSAKDMHVNEGSTKALDGIYYVSVVTSSLSILINGVTIGMGICLLHRRAKESDTTIAESANENSTTSTKI